MKKNSDGTVEATVSSTFTENGKTRVTEEIFSGSEEEVKAQIEALQHKPDEKKSPKISELQGIWSLDDSHSYVDFSIRHIVATSKGSFKTITGEFNFTEGQQNINVTIDANSINTSNDKRDAHLKEAEYFDVTQFPTLTFVSHKITETPHEILAQGQLTVKGITKDVLLSMKYLGQQATPWGYPSAAFEGEITINRSDFNVGESGGLLGDEVKVEFSIELNPKKEN
ncbi:MAG: YceI family protein [Flavobacteriaceae bacterium]